MHKIIEAIYDNGKLISQDELNIKKSRVLVIFLDDEEREKVKVFEKIPNVFLNGRKRKNFRMFTREELHDRKRLY